jgi:hypothetical protein
VTYPEGRRFCARRQHAEAETLYVNVIKKHKAGFYKVVWNVDGRRYVRRVHRKL